MLIEILIDICVVFPCNCIVLQRCCLFLLLNKIDKKSKIFLFFLYCNSTVVYTLFQLSQLMPVYPFEQNKELKQFVNMYTTSLTVKIYFNAFPDWSPQTALIRYHVSRNTLHCPKNSVITWSFKIINHYVVQVSVFKRQHCFFGVSCLSWILTYISV